MRPYCQACRHYHHDPAGACQARTTTPAGGAARCTCNHNTPPKDRTS